MTLLDYPGLRLADRPSMSARRRPEPLSPLLAGLEAQAAGRLAEPLVGITTDGAVPQGLFARDGGAGTAALLDAARVFLQTLSDQQRRQVQHRIDSVEWRRWLNVHPAVLRHGLLLADLTVTARGAALDLLRATLSVRGYQQARDIMRLNELVALLTGRSEDYGEWWYFISLFGTPDTDEPWGWQIDGHHLNLNCFVLGDQLVMTPAFMGSEPCVGHTDKYAGIRVFDREEAAGLALVRSLDARQAASAVLWPSIMPGEVPPERNVPIDGQMLAGAFQDNRRIGYEGVRADALTDAQRRLLLELVSTYVGWTADAHAAVRLHEVERHLDDTHFCWMGATDDAGPFYYRVQSPVVLIEFDHESGVVFDDPAPIRQHIHTVVRTPNGGDYGADLLGRHYERHHRPRPTYTA